VCAAPFSAAFDDGVLSRGAVIAHFLNMFAQSLFWPRMQVLPQVACFRSGGHPVTGIATHFVCNGCRAYASIACLMMVASLLGVSVHRRTA